MPKKSQINTSDMCENLILDTGAYAQDNNEALDSSIPKTTRYREAMPAPMNTEAFRDVVKTRRSVRKFTDKKIPKEVLDDCLHLAMLAPNSSNLQPWGFYVVQNSKKKQILVEACMNQNAAKTAAELIVIVARTGTYLDNAKANLKSWSLAHKMPKLYRDYYEKLVPFYYTQGPMNAFGALKKNVMRVAGKFRAVPRGPFSHHDMRVWAVKSASLAAENLMLAFRAYDFDTCPMEGFDEKRVNKLLKLPADAHVVMIIGAGERTEDGVYYPQVRFPDAQFVTYV